MEFLTDIPAKAQRVLSKLQNIAEGLTGQKQYTIFIRQDSNSLDDDDDILQNFMENNLPVVLGYHDNTRRITPGSYLPSAADSSKGFRVSATQDNTIQFESGASATYDSTHTIDGNKVAVWKCASQCPVLSDIPAGVKSVSGGADLREISRLQLVNNIIDQQCEPGARDIAGEFLVNLHCWLSENRSDLAEVVASQMSHDSLASLAVCIQPHKRSNHYISDDVLKEFSEFVSGKKGAETPVQAAYNADKSLYASIKLDAPSYNSLIDTNARSDDAFRTRREKLLKQANKPAIMELVKAEAEQNYKELPAVRNSLSVADKIMEAELRVASALLLDNHGVEGQAHAFKSVFSSCDLNTPWICHAHDNASLPDNVMFVSVIYLMMRSDALCYYPTKVPPVDSGIPGGSGYVSLSACGRGKLSSCIKANEGLRAIIEAITARKK